MNKSLIFLTVLTAAGSIGASAGELTLNVEVPGTLSSLVEDSQKFTTTKLTLSGTINGYDLQTIREMAGCDFYWNKTPGILEDLDISEVTIAGGDPVVSALGSDLTNPIIINARDNALSEELFTSTGIKHISMPASITAIYSAFSGSALEGTVTIPEGVEILGEYAFEGCSKVESFILPSTLRNIDDPAYMNKSAIGSHAFAGCTSLKSLDLPSGVTRIKQETFANCRFTSFIIPATVDYIDYCAFMDCTDLLDVTVEREVPPTLYYDAFHGVDVSKATLHVPAGTIDAYKAADGWCDFGTITDNPTAGINGISTTSEDETVYYNLQGTRIDGRPKTAGIYVTKGRKVVISE